MPHGRTTETLAGFVERHARQRPDDIAIRYGEWRWSWADWAARIRRAAAALQDAGVERGQCVAFWTKITRPAWKCCSPPHRSEP